MSTSPSLPPRVGEYMHALMVERLHPLLFTFGEGWQLQAVRGDAAFHGADADAGARMAEIMRDLFTGLPTGQDQGLPFVEFGNARAAHVHLIADGERFHVLLLDAEDEHARQQVRQQLGNEAALAGQAKTRAIDRLKEIRGELERQRASLAEANAFKGALIATLSHEFRTPLTSVFGYLHLLERQVGPGAEALPALQAIRRNATYLLALAENLLAYARGAADAVPLDPSAIDLLALAADVEAMFRPLAEDKGLDFRIECALGEATTAFLDGVRLRQVLINLLSNAIRYTAAGAVSASLAWREGHLHLRISDTGIGISDDFRERVFQPFNRGAQDGSKGAGLGLSIVRRLVAQMHGKLELESRVGAGTRFDIQLPAERAAAPRPAAAPAQPGRGCRGASVLVVDDDPDIAQLLEALLSDLGCRVRLASDAAGAIDEVLREAPDLLLIDVQMPGLSGNAAVFRLRSRGYRGRIVTLSATAASAAREAALRAGADHYLTKPLDIEAFIGVMQRLLGERGATRSDAPQVRA